MSAVTALNHLLNQAIALTGQQAKDAQGNQEALQKAYDAVKSRPSLYRIAYDIGHEIEQEKKAQLSFEAYHGIYQGIAVAFKFDDEDIVRALEKLSNDMAMREAMDSPIPF